MKKIFILFCLVFIFIGFGCAPSTPVFSYGVWWWNDELDYSYIDFSSQNNITEIYYCNSSFDENTSNFIKYAKNKNIKVFWLAGEYQWLEDNSNLITKINKYLDFQNTFSDTQFSGIHLDIEPHQHPNFDSIRYDLIYSLIDLAHTLKTTYPHINFNYDLPFWLDDEITYQNKSQPAFAHMIDIADKVTLMSYRDTAEKIYDVSREEIEYAQSLNKTLILGVETKSSEGDIVSFMEEGKQIMYQEIEKLQALLPPDFGVAIHHIKSWYELKD